MQVQKDHGVHLFDFDDKMSTDPDTLEKIDLTEFDPTAVCNDGSHAYFYWKKST